MTDMAKDLYYKIWDGNLAAKDKQLLKPMQSLIKDLNCKDNQTLYSWYEHCQWKWKQWEYATVLSYIDTPHPKNHKVLDMGCGYTPLIRYLGSIGMQAYGFDKDANPNQSNVKISKTLMHGDKVKYYNKNILKIKWKDNYFDTVICVSTLEHLFDNVNLKQKVITKAMTKTQKERVYINNISKAIHELLRITKPGGQMLLTIDAGWVAGVPFKLLQSIFKIESDKFPSDENIRSYWMADKYFMTKNKIYPNIPRQYTSLFVRIVKE